MKNLPNPIPLKVSAQPLSTPNDYEAFLKRYPSYAKTKSLDDLRKKDYSGKRTAGEIYLDYTGGGQFGLSQLRHHVNLLKNTLYGNPHSDNPTSTRSTELADKARERVLAFFNASPDEYCAIFTTNASAALRIVGESYPFRQGSHYTYFTDNHNSVLGIREYARTKGASIELIASTPPELRVTDAAVRQALRQHSRQPRLFAYPAQSNFSGVQHSLNFIRLAHDEGWDVLLDAAAFVPTNKLNLNLYKPDFVSLSFYKIFGWPTGVGCLIARKAALRKLQKPWFAGGTIWAASAQGDWHVLAPEHEAFEDGTINYLNLPGVTIGLNYIDHADIDIIHSRIISLTGWLIHQLLALRHSNGLPVIVLYGPRSTKDRGGTIACNMLDPSGAIIDERIIAAAAKQRGISIRTGCFCNPGSGETAFNLSKAMLRTAKMDSTENFEDQLKLIGMPSGGSIRVSLGLFTNFQDIVEFIEFASSFIDAFPKSNNLKPRGHC